MSKSKLKSHDLGYTPYLKHSTKTPISDDYDIQNKIGDGGFSIVKKGVRKSDGKEFAIKTVKKRKVPSHYILREVNIWKKASEHSPNRIVKLIEIYEDENAVNYVMELMEGGELFEKIVQMTDYSEVYAAKILKQLFKIVKEIHEIDIVHQDLKPENLLLTSKQGMSIKLCDFGLAEIAEDDHELTGVVGSRMYMAPEVEADKGHGKPVDYYAAGVIMYILLCGYPPFEPENGITVLEFPEPEWDNITPFAKELITQLLNPDPNKRPTPTQVLAHEWFKNVETINEPHSLNNTISNLRAFKNIGPGGTMKEYRGGKQSVIGLFAEQQQQQQQNGTKDAKISKHGSKHDISPRDSKPKHKSSTSTASSPSPSNPLTSSSSTVPSIKTASSDSVEPTTSPSSNPSSTPRGEPTTPKDKSKLKDPAPPKSGGKTKTPGSSKKNRDKRASVAVTQLLKNNELEKIKKNDTKGKRASMSTAALLEREGKIDFDPKAKIGSDSKDTKKSTPKANKTTRVGKMVDTSSLIYYNSLTSQNYEDDIDIGVQQFVGELQFELKGQKDLNEMLKKEISKLKDLIESENQKTKELADVVMNEIQNKRKFIEDERIKRRRVEALLAKSKESNDNSKKKADKGKKK
eukprot:TRINITY_DN1884_c1_g1_i1.p1 TRINITY_DN1884_c1_g1~~TRINITY_DN1884_c1_g1_i1.p1  ORF type:complete len:632 (-),score=199.52 TRINITY_DN1884_c1_g1_i1:1731-3626(-)